MTTIENTIWRAPTTVMGCINIIYAQGVLIKEMNKFRWRAAVDKSLMRGRKRGKFVYQFVFKWAVLTSKPR